ncbi:MAG: DUF481 domain-containing protein, partial [Sphingomonadales bacterium]|nr:DUF481 domain-containing protein [Sphingomonadales bacterium]
MRLPLLLAAAAPMLLANTDPATIPPQIRTMVDAALASGNESEIATIVKYAGNGAPDSKEAIAKLVDDWKRKRSEEKTAKLQDASF